LKKIGEKVAGASTPGFMTTYRIAIADRTKIGDYITDRLGALLRREGGMDWLGYWSETDIWLQVRKQNKRYEISLLVSTDNGKQIPLSVSEEWSAKGQRWRFAQAIEHFIAGTTSSASHELAIAELALARANDFEIRSREPFPQEAELTRLLARKDELNAYTAQVAASMRVRSLPSEDTEQQQVR